MTQLGKRQFERKTKMARRSVNDIVEKQIQRTANATDEVRKGIELVTESPTEKAAANADKAKSGYAKAIESGKWQRNLRSVSLADWKESTLAKVDRIPSGIAAAKGKLTEFHSQRENHQEKIDREMSNLPRRTLSDSIARMTKQVTEMAKFQFIRGKG